MDLSYFENPIFRDKIEAVDREMTWRAKGMLTIIYNLGSEVISLMAFGVVLFKLDWIFVAILAGTMIPVILIEFRQSIITYQWQTSWSRWWRHAWYYRWVLAAYDYLQEFRVFRLSPLFINRYLEIGSRYITAYRSHSVRMQNLHFLKNMLSNIIGYYGGLVLLLFRVVIETDYHWRCDDVYVGISSLAWEPFVTCQNYCRYLWKPSIPSRSAWDTPLSATHSPRTPCTNH